MTRISILVAALIFMVALPTTADTIHYAVAMGDTAEVKRLLDQDPDLLNAVDGDGALPLHSAAYYGELEIARLLMERGADVNACDNNGMSPLQHAAIRGHVNVARLLIENGAQLNHRDGGGNTPMLEAARSGSVEMVAYLLEQGGNLDDHTAHGSTLLHLSIVRGHPEMVRYLLEQGIDVNRSPDPVRAPMPIIRAVNFGYTEIVRTLLEFGADIGYVDPHYGRTFLHMAAIRGDAALAQALLDYGAQVDKLDNSSRSPLYYAIRYSNPTVVKLLRSRGAVPDETAKAAAVPNMLSGETSPRDAVVWYLSHSGWAVKTASHFLIFDYYIPPCNPDAPTLVNGRIVPEEIKDRKVVVFSSHDHSDHYESVIFEWEKIIPDITYVLGHQPNVETEYVYAAPRSEHIVDGLKVRTIPATDKGVGFLVEVDGLVIFHAGDHANGQVMLQPEYTDEIDYLASLGVSIDLAFLPVTGCSLGTPETVRAGVDYALGKLSPRVYFPQHAADSEYLFFDHANWVREQGYSGQVACAVASGDSFKYSQQQLQ